MSLNFEEQILDAAKSIAAATAALVKSASAAQRELVAQGRVSEELPPSIGPSLIGTFEVFFHRKLLLVARLASAA